MIMKHISIIVTGVLFVISSALHAQYARFVTDGVIEYEKSANMYALIRKSINKRNESYMQPAFDQYRKNQPQFKKLKSILTFSKDKTLFKPVDDTGGNLGIFGSYGMVNQNNIIYTNLSAASSITQKKVYEETFLVKDSLRKINWKITSETRDIAGYQCRRANAIVLDSIYVVAFYTDKIPVSGGPESFTGLPGMILGVALPHENITWFATKVADQSVPANTITPPSKGKAVNNKQLYETLMAALKSWGEYAQTALKAFLL